MFILPAHFLLWTQYQWCGGRGVPAKVDIRPRLRAAKGGRFHQRERMSHIRSCEWDSLLSIQQERRRQLKGGTTLEIPGGRGEGGVAAQTTWSLPITG